MRTTLLVSLLSALLVVRGGPLGQDPSLPATVATGAKLEIVYDESASQKRFFEGPSYDPKDHCLYFTAFGAGNSQILKLDGAGQVTVFMDKTSGINGTFMSRRGGLLGCQGEASKVLRIAIEEGKQGDAQVLAQDFDGKNFVAPNDIAEDCRGGFYFTDPDFREKAASAVYYVSPEGVVKPVVRDMKVPNGVYVAKGGKFLYVSDSDALHIRVYPINPFTGEVDQSQGKVFFDPKTENKNAPDGMTMDERGNMYFTGRGGVWCVDPAGSQLGFIPVPEFVSNCSFGGRDGRTLFLTCQNRVYSLAMNLRGWELASRHEFRGDEPLQFKTIVVDKAFRSEGVAVADVNKDGKLDILASDVWYEAPYWKMHEIREPAVYDGAKGYSRGFGSWCDDWNGDGYSDVIVIAFPGETAHWYENPKGQHTSADGKPVHWKEHRIWHSACNETPTYTALFGPGKRALVMGWQPPGKENEGVMAYFLPPKEGQGMWQEFAISGLRAPYTHRFSHGLGVGDVNGDGRNDVICPAGWWAQPESRDGRIAEREWQFHPAALNGGEAGSVADMFTIDINGDGLNDIVSSSAHRYGLWWFEQVRSADAEPEWRQHLIDDSFSQSHALHVVDLNGDGAKDIVTGSRYYAHQGHDPGEQDKIVLYWYEIKRQAGTAPRFDRHLIAFDVGIGTQFAVEDMNADGRLDIIVANKRGVHVLQQVPKEGVR
jgi:sugar lactone lactonase YvrE